MKKFLRNVLATIVGISIVGIIALVIFLITIFSMFSSAEPTYAVQDDTVLSLKLDGVLVDRAKEPNPILDYFGAEEANEIGLDNVLAAIKQAKNNDKVKGIYINAGMLSASSASLIEIRNQLIDFKESNKFIIAYGNYYTQGCYYLATVADKIILNPQGALNLTGISAQPMFYKGLLDKLGVEMQIFKVGTYKSAVEPFMTNKMSEANREQVNSYTQDVWSTILGGISSSREISVDRLNAITDSFPALRDPNMLVDNNLIDTLMYEVDVVKIIKNELAIQDEDKDPRFASISDLVSVPTKEKNTSDQIAILYAEGSIVSGSKNNEISDRFIIKQLEKLRKDENVKAVVFRVSSPGGSAYASEQIWKAVSDLKAEKPIVVSMGSYAASGGYYISCNASKILAQPSTITGSIGIFGMFPNVEGLTKKLGVSFDVVNTNKFSDFGNITRPMNTDEKAILQAYIERGYDLFLTRCAEGRGMSKDSLALIAEGRVWTGQQALKLGLVDAIGGIDDAIKEAAKLANIEEYNLADYPKKQGFLEQFLNTQKEDLTTKALKEYLGSDYLMLKTMKEIKEQDYVQARLPYDFALN